MNTTFNPVFFPSMLRFPLRLTAVTDWHGHIPFAYTIADIMRPKSYVELGVYMGDSYCNFLQAFQAMQLTPRCVGVDTFEGDEDMGSYGPEVLEKLEQYHQAKYGHFSQLWKRTFDQAVGGFRDGEIDLLHHDGLHSYEALSHDFNTWQPKLSDVAVMLVHDIELVHPKFGVRIWWNEIKNHYPHFEFTHSCGLGVLGVGKNQPDELVALFETQNQPEGDYIRTFYSLLGDHIDMIHQWRVMAENLAKQEDANEAGKETSP